MSSLSKLPKLSDPTSSQMHVTKRNKSYEIMSLDKILKRIKKMGEEANLTEINYTALTIKIVDQLYEKIPTVKIDELTAEQCASLSSIHPDYNVLAGRVVISNHHKSTNKSFYAVMKSLFQYRDIHKKHCPLISVELWEFVSKNKEWCDKLCDYSRDYFIDYFGFKTLEKAYLMRLDRVVVERPQHMWLRVSIGIHKDDMERIAETYHMMSQKWFTHATPTLFQSGTPQPQMSSCFLGAMDDSITGIFDTLKECAMISKLAGGIGLHIHNVRASGSLIRSTNGQSNGIVPMLKVFNATAKYVDQCVTPDTVIYTTQGPKQIQYCIAGETEIYNLTGGVEVIQDVLEHSYEGEVLVMKLNHNDKDLYVTPEHPIYVSRQGENPEWLEAKEIQVGDRFVIPLPKHNIDIDTFTTEDCYVYGILSILLTLWDNFDNSFCRKDVNIVNYRNSKQHAQIFLKKYLTQRHIEWTEIENRLEWKKTTVLPFRRAHFGNDYEHKIHSQWLNLPKHKLCWIVKGMMDAGYIKQVLDLNHPETFNFVYFHPEVGLTNFNRCLLFLLVKLGFHVTDSHRFSVPSEMGKFLVENTTIPSIWPDFIYSEVCTITHKPYKGVLYDLQMKNEHNYLLEHGLVHNGGGKRAGSFAIYLEPWHADIEAFLELRKNHGDENTKARDLFYGLWIPDLFMERVKTGGNWTLMCPDKCPGLADVYGERFVELYTQYESENRGNKVIKARDLWFQVLDAQMETGTPYILYKDAVNRKSNQKNVGVIKSSNLCSEICEISNETETAVCNLASIALPSCVLTDGIGVQGLADTFLMLNLAFCSPAAKEINRNIFETMYHAALEQSMELSKLEGPYETFSDSPASQGILQFDMWEVDPTQTRYDWQSLKKDIEMHGLRNSLLMALMPTASTSNILGYTECFEPITSNIYSRQTNAGQFALCNRFLMKDLIELGMWNTDLKNNIIANNGSIQHLDFIPPEIREKYKTVWEISMKDILDMSADRGAYICQSQSLNLYQEDPNYNSLTSMHFYGWNKKLKTGSYYLRRKAKHKAQQFTIEPQLQPISTNPNNNNSDNILLEDDEGCLMCSA